MTDPAEIYLSPPCCSDMVGEGRLWCENDEWLEGDCGTPEEHRPATRYVRADLTKPRVKELEGHLQDREFREWVEDQLPIKRKKRPAPATTRATGAGV